MENEQSYGTRDGEEPKLMALLADCICININEVLEAIK
jgi:hypothetical protein